MPSGQEARGRRTRLSLVPRLLRTSAFRYTLIYTAFFVLSVVGIGYFVYESTIGETMDSLDEELRAELFYLAEVNASSGNDGYAGLQNVDLEIQRLKIVKDSALYTILLDGPRARVLSTDFQSIPPEMRAAGDAMFEFDYAARAMNDAGRVVTETRPAVGRTATFLYSGTDGSQVRALILAARDIKDIDRIRNDARTVIIRLGGLTLFLGLVLGSVYASAFLSRVDAISKTVRAIRDGDLTKRVALSGSGDEFDQLSSNINAMLDQIERLMTGMRQVSDNIAHDLRSPLTRIKVRLETALPDARSGEAQVIEETTEDVERLLATFNALLSITRIESGEGGGSKAMVDVAGVAEELAELYEPAADEAGFVLRARIGRAPPILGSRELISQLIANLLDNALKYASRGDEPAARPTIELTVERGANGGAVLSVADDGPGISEADRERVLRRFVRLERSRSTQGNGLGLSLVAAIAQRHGATLSMGEGLARGDGGRGLGVRITFPPAPPAPKPSGAKASAATPTRTPELA